jgi:outer membrane protein assembly factor BamB
LDGNCADWLLEDARGRVYVGTDRGTIWCFSREGAQLWMYPAGPPVERARDPLLATGDLVLQTESGLSSIRDGHLRWKNPVAGRLWMADAAGTVYISYAQALRNYLAAVDQNGKILWAFDTGSEEFYPVALDSRGRLYCQNHVSSALACLGD